MSPPQVAAGVTDFSIALELPDDRAQVAELLGSLVGAFRAVTR